MTLLVKSLGVISYFTPVILLNMAVRQNVCKDGHIGTLLNFMKNRYNSTQFREYFYKLVNIEMFPEFRETAKAIGRYFLDSANYQDLEIEDDKENIVPGPYTKFSYTPEAFTARMAEIYKNLEKKMFKPIPFDSGIISYPATVGYDDEGNPVVKSKRYNVGRFSNRAIKELLIQSAPSNLLDGAWLQNILPALPTDRVRARLFSIWSDEAGNGKVEQNHANIYQALLKSNEIDLPSVTSKAFAEYPGFLDEAFIDPVFQAAMSLFPNQFLPELLGMTLFQEWETTPNSYRKVKSFEKRGLDSTFYSLHTAIDNIGGGHGFLAKETIELYLATKQEEGGNKLVQEMWERIWNGYVAWATLESFGLKLINRMLIVDRKQININLIDPKQPHCFPDLQEQAKQRMITLIQKHADLGDSIHRAVSIGGQSLSSLFKNPDKFLESLVSNGYVDPEHPQDSKLIKLFDFDGSMYKVFNQDDMKIILNWIESLRVSQSTVTKPMDFSPADQEPIEIKMKNLLASKKNINRIPHRRISLPLADGTTKTIDELFEDVAILMEAMVRGGWITPNSIEDSMFYTSLITNNGPMSSLFGDPDELEIIENWILDGAKSPLESFTELMT